MDVSIVIPLLNEEESLPELHAWIHRVAHEAKLSYEIIFIDDGSTDNSWSIIERLALSDTCVKGIRMNRNYGKSAALNMAFKKVSGEIVITMDADLQDAPDEIPALVKMIREGNFDLVSGWKEKRYDNTLTKNIPSKFFNSVTRFFSKIPLHDFNCGLKAYKNRVVKAIDIYGEMHRYIPVIAKEAGFTRIGEKVVEHRKRKYGVSKFGWERFVNGFLDLCTIMFLSKFGKRPMHFFGLMGVVSFLLGFVFTIVLVAGKFMYVYEVRLTSRPAFYLALTAMTLGAILFVGGFLAELLVRFNQEKTNYHIRETIE